MRAIAAIAGAESAILVDDIVEPGTVQGNELVCASVEVGICGTDREIVASKSPMVPTGSGCLVLGHECLARVVDTGPEVESFESGDYVLPLVRRSTVDCGRPDLLDTGQFVERGILAADGFSQPFWLDTEPFLLPVPAAVRDYAVLAEPISVVEKAVNEANTIQQARLGPAGFDWQNPRVGITGLGPIALAGVLVARANGWPTTVLGRDMIDSPRAQVVADSGADYLPLVEMQANECEFDLILECTGNDEVILMVSSALAARGISVWLGSSRTPQSRSHNVDVLVRDALVKNQIHLGSVNSAKRDFQDALTHLQWWVAKDAGWLERLITDRVSLDDAAWHFTHRQSNGIKVVVDY